MKNRINSPRALFIFTVALVYVSCAFPVLAADIEPSGISIIPDALIMPQGATRQLLVSVQPLDAVDRTYAIASSNEGVASVTADGLVRGISIGEAKITARSTRGGFTAECVVEVTAPVPVPRATSIDVTPKEIKLLVGESGKMNVVILPEGAGDKTFKWEFDGTSAVVAANGAVYGTSEGITRVTAVSNDGGFRSECIVSVTEPKVLGVSGSGCSTITGSAWSASLLAPLAAILFTKMRR